MFNQETYCRINMLFQLSTQWRSSHSWVFSTNNSHTSEQFNHCTRLFRVYSATVSAGGVATPTGRAGPWISPVSGALPLSVTHWFALSILTTSINVFLCDSLVDKHPGNRFAWAIYSGIESFDWRQNTLGRLLVPTSPSPRVQAQRPEPFQHNGSTNRHLMKARPAQMPEWPPFLKEVFRFELIYAPQQPLELT